MAITLPKYGTVVPSETTRFSDLGKELREFGESIEDVLESFDYNGADPDLVIARVSALESALNANTAAINALNAATGLRRGTVAQRAAAGDPLPEQMWQDTDGDRQLWSSGPDGKWRRHEGTATAPAAAWPSTGGTPAMAARTVTFTLPTVLAPDETLLIAQVPYSGNGYTWASLATVIRNANDTSINIRFMQLFNTSQQPLTIGWRVIKAST